MSMIPELFTINPLHLARVLWPPAPMRPGFYGLQEDVIQSVDDNSLTLVPAANMVGKDYLAGATAIMFFLRGLFRGGCRVVTTSVADKHLEVLWGEIGRFLQTSAHPLIYPQGPLIVTHRDIKGVGCQCCGPLGGDHICKISYLVGMVAERPEKMAGHHARNTLGIMDECSGIDDEVFVQIQKWAKRILCIGNCRPCDNFWLREVEAGDLLAA